MPQPECSAPGPWWAGSGAGCDGDDLRKLVSELGKGVEVKASEAKLWGKQASNLGQFLSLMVSFLEANIEETKQISLPACFLPSCLFHSFPPSLLSSSSPPLPALLPLPAMAFCVSGFPCSLSSLLTPEVLGL